MITIQTIVSSLTGLLIIYSLYRWGKKGWEEWSREDPGSRWGDP